MYAIRSYYGGMLAKSKADKRKQKRKQKQVQARRARAGQAAADKGWFYYEEAFYYHDIADPSQALKFIKKAIKLLPRITSYNVCYTKLLRGCFLSGFCQPPTGSGLLIRAMNMTF